MEGISDIKIIGIDETRPPQIRKEPYIDIFFKLSHQAPSEWCKDFNNLLAKHPQQTRIKEKEGIFIETWVRNPDDIVALLDDLKKSVMECTHQYIERIERLTQQAKDANTTQQEASGEQGRLNKIIASLEFDEMSQ
ncbi:MAG: hypothetical protein PVJ63_08500 [Thioalkalispiraceae bacterium]|jgi:hypothetical protein